MPRFTAAPERMVKLFEDAIKPFTQAEQKKVFGYPAAFANGNMFAGLHGDNMILRLPDEEREQFIAEHKAGVFEPMPGRPMKEYVVVPAAILKSPAKLQTWLARSMAYAGSLPPKSARKKRR